MHLHFIKALMAMNSFDWHVPAWAVECLPVRMARRCVRPRAPLSSSSTEPSDFQLLVDVSVIYQTDARTGIQRVVRALLLQLLQAPPADFVVRPVFATRKHGYRYANSEFLNGSARNAVDTAENVKVKSGDIFLGLDLSAHLLPRHQSDILRWKKSGVKLHIIVYDLLPILYPEWFNSKTTRNFKRWIHWLAIYADNAICISQTVKVELNTWLNSRFGLSSKEFISSTIVLGSDIIASAPSKGFPGNAEEFLDIFRKAPTVLMVGTVEPRKGHDQALSAFEKIWCNSHFSPVLVIVGRPGWRTDSLQMKLRTHAEAGKRLFWLEEVSDEYLEQLYAACKSVLVASRAEGFGLPLFEAVRHGKPVLARDIPVFRECQAASISYFNGNSSSAMAGELIQLLSSDNGSDYLLEQAPTWETSAKQLLHCLGLSHIKPNGISAHNSQFKNKLLNTSSEEINLS